jgi:hypothetical protein
VINPYSLIISQSLKGFRACGRDQGFPSAQGCRPFLTENGHTGPFSGRAEPLDLRIQKSEEIPKGKPMEKGEVVTSP